MSATRRLLSLLAAYAIALQLLLLPLGVAAGALTAGAHCAPDGTAQHRTDGCACCASGCGTLCQNHVLAAPETAVALEPDRTSRIVRPGIAFEQPVRPPADLAIRARGPPRFRRA